MIVALRVPGVEDIGPFRSPVITPSRLAAFRAFPKADFIFSQNRAVLKKHQEPFVFDDQHFVNMIKRCKSGPSTENEAGQ